MEMHQLTWMTQLTQFHNIVTMKQKIRWTKRIYEKNLSLTHMRLRQLHFPSIRTPASFSSGLANSDKGGKDLLLRNSILSLCGENDSAGRGGASTISIISCGGRWYPLLNDESTSTWNITTTWCAWADNSYC